MFTDTFQNLNNWLVSDWNAPGGGMFHPDMVTTDANGLQIKVSQDQDMTLHQIGLLSSLPTLGTIHSVGGEIQSKQKFSYGTYEWIAKVSATADGKAVSGQITGLFNFVTNSQTEIDFEIEGQHPNTLWTTNWHSTSHKQASSSAVPYPEQNFHSYKFIWSPGKIQFFFDNVPVGTHTKNVPVAPAFVMINHWGTNSTGWGGLATPNVDRFMFVKSFTFTPHS